MKLKNISDSVRKLTSFGQIVIVRPGEIVDVEKPIYDNMVFEKVNTKKSKEKQEKAMTEKEVD